MSYFGPQQVAAIGTDRFNTPDPIRFDQNIWNALRQNPEMLWKASWRQTQRMKCYRLIEAESDGLVITESDLYGFDRRQLLLGKWVEGWDSRFTLWYSEGKAEDYLTNMVYWPIASRGMCDVLYSIAPNQIQFLPLNIVHKPTGETLQDYSGVSETVKAVLEVGGFTGCGFREVPVF